ncbi:MAG: D-tyrosyl-tRNA(Tyr) deacylase [Gammaproteobacteria bacterium]|nr:D-tyrosyl-tRNA(Tyr) deacylase [Gammaproteobacteria bacterium]
MIGLLQRVTQARVTIDGEVVASIGAGVLVLVGIERVDGENQAHRLLERLLGYRIFEDHEGKMNLSLRDIHGGLLLVPQFTLAANTHRGMRPSFSPAAPPAEGRRLYQMLVDMAHREHNPVASGRFGANMQVTLVNDGPVTFWLQAR